MCVPEGLVSREEGSAVSEHLRRSQLRKHEALGYQNAFGQRLRARKGEGDSAVDIHLRQKKGRHLRLLGASKEAGKLQRAAVLSERAKKQKSFLSRRLQ